MKKIALFSMVALALLFNQCKKNETPVADEGIYITLNAGCVNDGEKTTWTPSSGEFKWKSGKTEYIYVGGSNHTGCIGVLSGTGNGQSSMSFTGTITGATSGETLYFFYLGNNRTETTAATAKTTLDFSQYGSTSPDVLTNYHVAIGSATYTGSTSFTDIPLTMATAFAYFDFTEFFLWDNFSDLLSIQVDLPEIGDIYPMQAPPIEISGNDVYRGIRIDYQHGTIIPQNKSTFTFYTAYDGMSYEALVPSTESSTNLIFSSKYGSGSITFNNGIRAGKYYSNDGEALEVTPDITELQQIYNEFDDWGWDDIYTFIPKFMGEDVLAEIEAIVGSETDYECYEYYRYLSFSDINDIEALPDVSVTFRQPTPIEEDTPVAMLFGYEDDNGKIQWHVFEGTGTPDAYVQMVFDDLDWLEPVADGRPVSLYTIVSTDALGGKKANK